MSSKLQGIPVEHKTYGSGRAIEATITSTGRAVLRVVIDNGGETRELIADPAFWVTSDIEDIFDRLRAGQEREQTMRRWRQKRRGGHRVSRRKSGKRTRTRQTAIRWT